MLNPIRNGNFTNPASPTSYGQLSNGRDERNLVAWSEDVTRQADPMPTREYGGDGEIKDDVQLSPEAWSGPRQATETGASFGHDMAVQARKWKREAQEAADRRALEQRLRAGRP